MKIVHFFFIAINLRSHAPYMYDSPNCKTSHLSGIAFRAMIEN